VVFLLLAVLCLALIGFACSCFGGHSTPAVERAFAEPAVLIEMWSIVVLSLVAVTLVLVRAPGGFGRASPAVLQRFLF